MSNKKPYVYVNYPFITPDEFMELLYAVCEKPTNYSPTGTFYESVAFLDGYAKGRIKPKFSGEAHSELLPFLVWILTKWDIDINKPSWGWKTVREHYSSDQETFENLPKLFREFLETQE